MNIERIAEEVTKTILASPREDITNELVELIDKKRIADELVKLARLLIGADSGKFKPIMLGDGIYGGRVISPSARKPGTIQVTNFTADGKPAGHSEYGSLADAIDEYWQELDNPISNIARSLGKNIHKSWEEATFEHRDKSKLVKKNFAYVSPYRPMWGISVSGDVSASKDGKVGVLYRDEPLDLHTMEHLSLIPVTKKAIQDFAHQISKKLN